MADEAGYDRTAPDQAPATSGRRAPRIRVGAIIAVALGVGFLVWLVVVRDDSSGTSPSSQRRATAQAVSEDALSKLSERTRRPIYWAGRDSSTEYELSRTASGLVYVRYLPKGVSIGSDDPYLTVGTYPLRNAYAVTRTVSRRSTSRVIPMDGAVAFYGKRSPTHVYVAYPGIDYQIEVYDPSPSKARQVVTSGRLGPVPAGGGIATPASGPRSVSPAKLEAVAASLRRPIYWIGNRPAARYELTTLPDGRIFVRYLPRTVRVGTRKAYLTIGTYPMKNALRVTRGLLQNPDVVPIKVTGGGVALYSKKRATNIYVAFPGIDYQVEVYSPVPARARRVVRSQRIAPVG
jgi:hypothetical protein